MEYQAVPALLRSAYGQTNVFGRCALVAGENAVDFYSDYIPLLRLNAPAEVAWLAGKQEQVVFQGRAYLSSDERVRVVGVEPQVLRLPRAVLALNTEIPARVAPANRPGAAADAEIVYLAQGLIKLRAKNHAAQGQKLLLWAEVDFLTLDGVQLTVEERVLLSGQRALLLCSVTPGSDENYIALKTYAAKLAARQKREEQDG